MIPFFMISASTFAGASHVRCEVQDTNLPMVIDFQRHIIASSDSIESSQYAVFKMVGIYENGNVLQGIHQGVSFDDAIEVNFQSGTVTFGSPRRAQNGSARFLIGGKTELLTIRNCRNSPF
jgi:hypothetical protein